jgi:hypothetical protein
LKVIVENKGSDSFNINNGDKIAQLILESATIPPVIVVDVLTTTQRDTKGFGSTENPLPIDPIPPIATLNTLTHGYSDKLQHYQVDLSSDPYNNVMTIDIDRRGKHKNFGLTLNDCDKRDNTVKITTCLPGSAARRVLKWTTTLKGSDLLQVNNTKVTNASEAERLIGLTTGPQFTIKIGTLDKHAMNLEEGVPQLHFDQLRVIAQHLYEIKNSKWWKDSEHDTAEMTAIINAAMVAAPPNAAVPRKKPKKRPDKLT